MTDRELMPNVSISRFDVGWCKHTYQTYLQSGVNRNPSELHYLSDLWMSHDTCREVQLAFTAAINLLLRHIGDLPQALNT